MIPKKLLVGMIAFLFQPVDKDISVQLNFVPVRQEAKLKFYLRF